LSACSRDAQQRAPTLGSEQQVLTRKEGWAKEKVVKSVSVFPKWRQSCREVPRIRCCSGGGGKGLCSHIHETETK
jgi:hypothetical protein